VDKVQPVQALLEPSPMLEGGVSGQVLRGGTRVRALARASKLLRPEGDEAWTVTIVGTWGYTHLSDGIHILTGYPGGLYYAYVL